MTKLTLVERLSLEEPEPLATVIQKYHPEKVTDATLKFWHKEGVVGKDGERYRLETYKAGGRVYTSEKAYYRWLEALNKEPV